MPLLPPIRPVNERSGAIRAGLIVGASTGAYGVSFGALAVASGLSIWQTQVLSLVLFSGGSQFALVSVIGGGGSAIAAVATSTVLGIRNALYALQMSHLLPVRGLKRLAAAQFTIDESTAVALGQQEPAAARAGFWATGLATFTFWNAMTLMGALLGDALGDPRRWGLDAAAAAAFCALLWPRLRTLDARLAALGGALIALLAIPVVPAGIPVLLAVIAAVAVGWWSGTHQSPPLKRQSQ